MLKDFKNHSHVLCPETIEHSRGEAIIVERLDLIQNLENYEDKMRGRRHVRPAPLDMRDVLPPDIYHRYDTIVQYLEVSVWGWAHVPFSVSPITLIKCIRISAGYIRAARVRVPAGAGADSRGAAHPRCAGGAGRAGRGHAHRAAGRRHARQGVDHRGHRAQL